MAFGIKIVLNAKSISQVTVEEEEGTAADLEVSDSRLCLRFVLMY